MKAMKKNNPSQLELTFKRPEFQTTLRLTKSESGSGFCDRIEAPKQRKQQPKPKSPSANNA